MNTIALASWTPEGSIGDLFRTMGRYVSPPPGLRPPIEWGSEGRIRELIGGSVTGPIKVPSEYLEAVAERAA